MSVGLNSHPLFLLACLLAAGALTYWTYRRTTPRLSPLVKGLLGGLRFLALAILLIVLFDPIISRSTATETPPVLAVLVDNSASLTLADDAQVRAQLETAELRGVEGEVRLFQFDSDIRRVDRPDSLTFGGGRTNIGRAIDYVRQELREENVRSIVLLSDGLYNAGRSPLYSSEESLVPIHTIVVGDTSRFRDIRIQEVLTNEIAYAGAELPVAVRILSDGFDGQEVTVGIREGGRTLASRSVRLTGDGTEQTVELALTPDQPGFTQFTTFVTEHEGEATHRNNARTVGVQVIDGRRQILLLGGAPDPDVGALRQALSADASLEVVPRIQRDPNTFYEGPLPSSLEEFDLVVMAGFPHARASSELVARVQTLLDEDPTPVLLVAGRRLNAMALQQMGDAVIPAWPTSSVTSVHEAQAALTSSGRSHPIMRGHTTGTEAWDALPPLVYPDAAWQTSPDARVLATVRSRGVDLGEPLVIIRSRSGRRSAALLGANSWQWRTLPPSLEAYEGVFDRFVENLVQWLTTPDDDRLVRVRPTQPRFEGGEAVRFIGEVYDERLQPVSDAAVQVNVESAEGESFPFTMTAEGNGRYRLDAGALAEGAYSFSATATRQDVTLGNDRGSFSVGALELEFAETRADAALMRQIAARTGGRSVDLTGMSDLIQDIAGSAAFRPEVEHVVQESSLRHAYLLLVLALLFLASEWVLRKRSGMV